MTLSEAMRRRLEGLVGLHGRSNGPDGVKLYGETYVRATDEAVRLIQELRDHATQERFVYYHAWRVGDVVMWDELATMHRGAGDARPEERRIMLRTIVHPF